ncbi:UDP-glucose dehydrogenase family protein [Sphingomicrobium astaxanthinifaciens]|uniref:UDP-glucose dehydrogenase family protein n=1 Tax=Sphingomicrobium astaxanthinifaciens TaxID=1227949 RepID=UPI001FCB385F|nr:UDP-glucose/GDP-mannose dehydrogenase family protein [Sphingomicrobium astaxanthinifaciens]MCJ7420318.1 UDP-glucose/GDP-mannose dehydrogenase family protein [Sphingomicrobium astaxanthinifaciens]
MKIVVIGTGYVGLVSGACFADFGHHVTCVDKDPKKIEMLEAGQMPIWEPGLDSLVESNVKKGRLHFTTELAPSLAGAEAVFIAVGTPSRRGDGHADLSYVFAAVKELAGALDHPVVVVTKSTVPVGTGDEISKILKENGAPEGCTVASNPEFLREGAAIADFKHPDRILIGANDEKAREVLREIYRPLFLNRAPMLFTSRRTAELTKYAANAFLATKISFINEMADLCEAVGADVQDVARGIGLDNRIGPKFLHAGPGYGGSCFPKDTLALLRTAEEAGVKNQIVSAVVKVNDDRKNAMADRVEQALGGSADGKTVAVLGLTFKPNTDDMRDAPSIPLVNMLANKGAKLRVFDPVGMEMAKPHMPEGLHWARDEHDAIAGADALVIVTEWDEFRALDLDAVAQAMNGKLLIDLRNIYSRAEAERAGFDYLPIGR